MKISELMKRLGELQGEHGDAAVELELNYEDEFGSPVFAEIDEVIYEKYPNLVFISAGNRT